MIFPDPWLDAADIAGRLQQPEGTLVAVVGARAWCAKCRQLHPAFARLAGLSKASNTVWLWLDLEDHAEFLGRFVPEDLPLLLHLREGQLMEWGTVEAFDRTGWRLRPSGRAEDLPPLWKIFSTANWAE